jgi:hypothetical protein
LIVDVQTTVASLSDWDITQIIEDLVRERQLQPAEHLVDMGYVTAEHLLRSQR